jgi:hypothetical protein
MRNLFFSIALITTAAFSCCYAQAQETTPQTNNQTNAQTENKTAQNNQQTNTQTNTQTQTQQPQKDTQAPSTQTEDQTKKTQDQTQSEFSNVNLMFIQTAKTAALTTIQNKTGYYTLTLTGVNPYVTYFSERPNRLQGVASLENFVKAWDVGTNSLKDNNPNGVITAVKINGLTNSNEKTFLITLSSPNYNLQKSELSYTVKAMDTSGFLFKDIRLEDVILVLD